MTSDGPGASRLRSAIRAERLISAAERATEGSVRILAYHGVADAAAFEAQMSVVADRWQAISGEEMAELIANPERKRPRTVWITFDDADPSVIDVGLPILEDLGLPATVFACPGLVDDQQPYWWDVVDWAAGAGHLPPELARLDRPVEQVKLFDDPDRRRLIADLATHAEVDTFGTSRSANLAELTRWRDSGREVGAHSWDHPCLDRCDADEQRRQITESRSWFDDTGLDPVGLFAYPNGNRAEATERALTECSYALGALHDHRFTRLGGHPLRISRLRVEASDPIDRFRSIVAGVQPLVWHARQRISR